MYQTELQDCIEEAIKWRRDLSLDWATSPTLLDGKTNCQDEGHLDSLSMCIPTTVGFTACIRSGTDRFYWHHPFTVYPTEAGCVSLVLLHHVTCDDAG